MGLDMYLTKINKGEKYVAPNFGTEIGYWRKANHIHNWFVKNVQDGVDDCEAYIVSKYQLTELLDACRTVLASCKGAEHGAVEDWTVANNILPTCGGFFFGSTDYNEYYLKDIVRTIVILDNALKTVDFDKEEVLYQASW